MSQPVLWILLTTYRRTEECLQTVQALKQNLIYGNIGWVVVDDGTGGNHLRDIVEEIGYSYTIIRRELREGVGANMNWGLRQIFDRGDELILTMEDDWILDRPVDMEPYVNLLINHEKYGMVRFGYLAANLLGYLVSEEGKLFWRLEPNGETYRFAGHPSLRHKRFFDHYGFYAEGLSPGGNELSMCHKVNVNPTGPYIVYPADCGQWGFFGHIGSESLGEIVP